VLGETDEVMISRNRSIVGLEGVWSRVEKPYVPVDSRCVREILTSEAWEMDEKGRSTVQYAVRRSSGAFHLFRTRHGLLPLKRLLAISAITKGVVA
jgi:hypothetical protein